MELQICFNIYPLIVLAIISKSRAFEEAHLNYNIIRSMSRAGTPTDNPIIESLNGLIKAEMACDFRC